MTSSKIVALAGLFLVASLFALADEPPIAQTRPPGHPTFLPQQQQAPGSYPRPPNPQNRQEVPPMAKPFGMPGVVGIQKGKWEGTDYLGYLSNHVGLDIEILKSETVPAISGAAVIGPKVSEIFTRGNLVPSADVTQGPPLPFLHILMIIYPVGRDTYAIFGAARLFEQIQVIRKDFIPAGYWQGITWEVQDVTLADSKQLDAQMTALAEKLGQSFVTRYWEYNSAINPNNNGFRR